MSNRYIQKILEISLHHLLDIVYRHKLPQILTNSLASDSKYSKPLISIVVPIYRPKILWLTDCIESVLQQSYQNMELILVDDNSNDPAITSVLLKYKNNKKVKLVVNQKNLNIVGATNVGLKIAKGDWVGFLDHDDILWPNALTEASNTINNNTNIKYIYTDQDKIDDNGTHFDPFLKQDFSFDLLRQTNYFNHFTLIKTDLLKKLDYLRAGTNGAQDWDLALRVSNVVGQNQIFHLSKILYSWRSSINSTASSSGIIKGQQKISAVQKEVLEYDLSSRHQNSTVNQTRYLGIWSTNHRPTILPYQLFLNSLVVLCTKH